MADEAQALRLAALDRIGSSLTERSVFNYEGTALDQLVLRYVECAGGREQITLLCSTRPCMDERLQESVREFARARGLAVTGHAGECEIREGAFVSVQCGLVKAPLESCFEDRGGVQLISAIVNERTKAPMLTTNDNLQSFTWEEPCTLTPQGKGWRLVFPFAGFGALEIAAAFQAEFGRAPHEWEIPMCVLPCYNEKELRLFADVSGLL